MKYRCPICGYVFSSKIDRCPSCNRKFIYPAEEEKPVEEAEVKVEGVKEEIKEEAAHAPVIEKKPEPQVIEKTVIKEVPAKFEKKGKSEFTGFTLGYIGWRIAGFFLTLFTLGICYPVALGWIYRWEVNNTVVDGHKMRFNGLASSLIPRWILWELLSIITIGIFALTLPVRFQKWKVARMVIVD